MIDFKTTDASSYDSVTAELDRFTDRFSTPLAARMISLAELVPAERVLDIGTGDRDRCASRGRKGWAQWKSRRDRPVRWHAGGSPG